MNVQTRYLEKLKTEHLLVDVYTDNFDESHCGFVVAYSDEFLLLEKFNTNCLYDGVCVVQRTHITRIRWDGNDLRSTAKLLSNARRMPANLTFDLQSTQTVLQSLYDTFRHVTVHIQEIDTDVCFIGEIYELDEDSLVINEFGTQSTLDRKFIWLKLEDITRIDADGIYENNLCKLFLSE